MIHFLSSFRRSCYLAIVKKIWSYCKDIYVSISSSMVLCNYSLSYSYFAYFRTLRSILWCLGCIEADIWGKLQNWTFWITWLPAVAQPPRRDHPLSLNCTEAHSEMLCWWSRQCVAFFLLLKLCCLVQISFPVMLPEEYMYLPPAPQKGCSQWVMSCSLVIPLPLQWQNFCEKVDFQENQHFIIDLRLKGEVQKENEMWNSFTGSNFLIELSNQNVGRKQRMIKSSASIRSSCFAESRAAWEMRSVYNTFMA